MVDVLVLTWNVPSGVGYFASPTVIGTPPCVTFPAPSVNHAVFVLRWTQAFASALHGVEAASAVPGDATVPAMAATPPSTAIILRFIVCLPLSFGYGM